MIKKILAGYPTQPVIYIAPLVIIVVIAAYYRNVYTECTRHVDMRDRLLMLIRQSLDSQTRAPVRLVEATSFEWDGVQILVNFKPQGKVLDCPFQWGWSKEKRDSIAREGMLTVLVFLNLGKIVDYIEIRSDQMKFRNLNNPYTLDEAVFEVKPSGPDSATLVPVEELTY